MYSVDHKLFIIMKKIALQLFIAFTATFSLTCQVTGVNYLLHYNCETNLYEVKLKILEGSALTIPHRAQFNAQITLVVPTGTSFEIVELVNPINNNQNYEGTVPTTWSFGSTLISPDADPYHDFYPAAPKLAPASFYNNLETDDQPILFICKIGDSDEYNPNYRFYENGTDIGGGSNYSNGFTLGSPTQLYSNNEYKSCATDTQEENITSLVAYPNPFSNEINVELFEKAESIEIVDNIGKVVYVSNNQKAGRLAINSSQFPSGTYMLRIQTINTHQVIRVVKP